MKSFFLVLALVAGALSLVSSLGLMRTRALTPTLALMGWVVALGLALLALYALRTALRYRHDPFSRQDEEERLRRSMGEWRS